MPEANIPGCTGRPTVTKEEEVLMTQSNEKRLPTDMPEDTPYWWGFSQHGILSEKFSHLKSFMGFKMITESIFNNKQDVFALCSTDVEWDGTEATRSSSSKRITKLTDDAKEQHKKKRRLQGRDERRMKQRDKRLTCSITMEVCHIPNLLSADVFMALSKTGLDLQDGLDLFEHRVVRACIDYVWWNQTGASLKRNCFFSLVGKL